MKMISFLLLNLLLISSVFSQIPGKIEGFVKDEKSEALPGANVSIEGTMSGASTNLEGKFIILNVRPGIYTLKVQFIGFKTVRVQNVQIIADQSSKINVTLKESAIDLGEEVVVTAERPLIRKDLTSKVVTMTGNEIRQLSVNSIQEILATQPGVSVLSGTPIAKAGYNAQGIEDFRMRGGRNNEVGLYIDGVKVSNPVFGGFGTHINNTAIQQLSIVSGGFNAKYGNALSGMINLTTKEAGEKPTGSLSYQSSMPFGISELSWGAQQAKHWQNIQGTFGTRIPGLPRTSLFVSGEVRASASNVYEFDDITWNDYRTIHPDDSTTLTLPTSEEIIQEYLRYESLDSIAGNLAANWDEVKGPDGREINPLDQFRGWKGLGWDNSYNIFAKIVTHPTSSIKLVFSLLRDQRYRQGANYSLSSYRYFYNMPGQNVQIFHSQKETLALTHVLNSKTFYTFHISRFVSDRKIRVLKSLENQYKSQWNIFEPDWDNVKTPEEHIPYLGAQAVWEPFETRFYVLADNRWHADDKSITYEARGDFVRQLGKSH
ncbi:carboxypeptidase-like regulatory domain-containing protein [candidate division KSB1 bacterium]|nr:carboxypeptidase-like regulatory domain-containing protein [candidate division KSB1 bacterium]